MHSIPNMYCACNITCKAYKNAYRLCIYDYKLLFICKFLEYSTATQIISRCRVRCHVHHCGHDEPMMIAKLSYSLLSISRDYGTNWPIFWEIPGFWDLIFKKMDINDKRTLWIWTEHCVCSGIQCL